MAEAFRLSQTPDFKRLFEIHHFYVEGKANKEKTSRKYSGANAREKKPRRGDQAPVGKLGGSLRGDCYELLGLL
jgi:hypothetical protein